MKSAVAIESTPSAPNANSSLLDSSDFLIDSADLLTQASKRGAQEAIQGKAKPTIDEFIGEQYNYSPDEAQSYLVSYSSIIRNRPFNEKSEEKDLPETAKLVPAKK